MSRKLKTKLGKKFTANKYIDSKRKTYNKMKIKIILIIIIKKGGVIMKSWLKTLLQAIAAAIGAILGTGIN